MGRAVRIKDGELTGVVVDIVRSDDGVVRLLPTDRQLIPDAVSKRLRLRLPEENTTEVIMLLFNTYSYRYR